MSEFEDEIFEKRIFDLDKLVPYGFKKVDGYFTFSKKICNDSFRVDIKVIDSLTIEGKIFDLDFDEEYTLYRNPLQKGEFVSIIRDAYSDILIDIRNQCCINMFFASKQANRIANAIEKLYHVKPEFLFEGDTETGVFRNNKDKKWFGIIMMIKKNKLTNEEGKVEIINVKLPKDVIKEKLDKDGYYPAFHMNKKYWISIVLDDTLTDEEILEDVDMSLSLTNEPDYWIVPGNPKFFDVISYFENNSVVDWKQSTNVAKNDIVYIYVGAPYSSIMFKCQAIDVDIPSSYQDENIKIKKSMRLKKIENKSVSFKWLNENGIKSIRGPIKIDKAIYKKIEKVS